ncbi:GAF domain-containing protein [Pseudanabaena biceps]|nr:GAF domain-containing protein [Pseudanabaena biceps]
MDEVPPFFSFGDNLEVETIAAAMFSSSSPEELLQIFLVDLGDKLGADRVAIYHFCNSSDDLEVGKILVDAVTPKFLSLKDQGLSINYFGADSLQNYPRDRPLLINNIQQITDKTIANQQVYQQWQQSNVQSMMSVPILLDALDSESPMWGIALVQQCDHLRQWQPKETFLLMELAQVLGKCLRKWQLRLQLPYISANQINSIDAIASSDIDDQLIEGDTEDLTAIRTTISEAISFPIETSQKNNNDQAAQEIAWTSDWQPTEDEENPIFDRDSEQSINSSINKAIDVAMQKLDWRMQKSQPYPMQFGSIDSSDVDDIDAESATIENILQEQGQPKVEYLQQQISELITIIEERSLEIAELRSQIQQLMNSQQEFRQILSDLQVESLTQDVQQRLIAIYPAIEKT